MRRPAKLFAAIVATLAMSVSLAKAESYVISSDVWGLYQEYLVRIDNGHKPGAYAITTDGYGAFYVWCSETRCRQGATYGQEAVNRCEKEYDTDCVVFAVRDDIRVDYTVASTAPQSSVPDLAPAPVTHVTVPAAVQADIKVYLSNASLGGKAWALALANDGSEVASASCQATGGGGYFGGGGAGCNLVSGSPQENASREALMRCGGPAKCLLLYEGTAKKASIDIVSGAEGSAEAAAPLPPAEQPAAAQQPAPQQAAVQQPNVTAPKNLTPPPPAVKIAVSPAVKAEIDSYLENTQSSGKAWALAIARDGSDVGFASCPTSGGWSGGRACEPVRGSPQELASREAVMRCGGAAACTLLYEGAQKTGNIEIVTP